MKNFIILLVILSISKISYAQDATSASVAKQTVQENDSSEDEIIVEARIIKLKKQALNLAKSVTPRQDLSESLPRFNSPICIFIYGLDKDYGVAFIKHMHKNIIDIGLKIDKSGCKPNLIVAFVNNIEKEVEILTEDKNFSWVTSSLRKFELQRISNQKGVTRAWRTVVPGTRAGIELVKTRFVKGIAGELPREVYDNPEASSGRLSASTSNLVKGSIVIFDWDGVDNKTVGQLADFATMRSLVPVDEVKSSEEDSLDTILSIFTEEGGPDALTDFDKAYLKAYYRPNTLTNRRGKTLNEISNYLVKISEESDE
jgi:hypothetical protein